MPTIQHRTKQTQTPALCSYSSIDGALTGATDMMNCDIYGTSEVARAMPLKRHCLSRSVCHPKYTAMYNLSSSLVSQQASLGPELPHLSLLSYRITCPPLPITRTTHTLDTEQVLNHTCDNGLGILVWEHKFYPLTESLFREYLFSL